MKKVMIDTIHRHAGAEYPRGSCGLIVIRKGREKYLPCQNAAHGTEHFIISAQDYAKAEEHGEIVAVVHSHPDAPATPSEADRSGSVNSDSSLSGSFASQSWPQGRHQEQKHDKENQTKSHKELQSQSGLNRITWR